MDNGLLLNADGTSQLGQMQQPNPADYPSLVCDKCGNRIFVAVALFKKVSGMALGLGVDHIAMPVYKTLQCTKCGEIVELDRDEFNTVLKRLEEEDKTLDKPKSNIII